METAEMFKFFRQYQSYLLVVGGSLLMIVFLIEPALRMFSPSREKMVIGRLDGAKITFGDQDTAGADLYVLDRLGIWPNAREAIEPLAWMLAMHDARKHGLEVGQLEISQMLALRGLDEIALKNTAIQMGVSTGLIRRAVGHWLLVEEYQELALGLRTVSPLARTQAMLQAQQLQNQAYAQISKTMEEGGSAANISPAARQAVEQSMLEASQLAWSVTPSPRLSQPLVQHFLHDQGAKVRLSLVRIPAERSKDKFPAPREAELMSLFEEYKDILPGEGKPYGFGYRQPNRVKLEYLEIVPASLMSAVQVDEADALAYYQANKTAIPACQHAGG
ncbi:MAG: hypothetical protein HC898_00530 [Phycisphaerales bacterium]|nr:hypothetical protein [Phycisphaerales bacterium]